jgi:membrane-associated phospholipid phosphatase
MVRNLFWWLVSAIVYFILSAGVMLFAGTLIMLVFGSLIFPYVNSDTHMFTLIIQIISFILFLILYMVDPLGIRKH